MTVGAEATDLDAIDEDLVAFVSPVGDADRRRSLLEDPYGFFDRLREQAPVHHCRPLDTTFITSYAETRQLWRERRFSSVQPRRLGLTAAQRAWVETGFAFTDPPEHTRLRRVCAAVFTPKAVESQRANAQRISAELVAQMSERTDTFDFKQELAHPLPQRVISDMLGIPAVERDNFTRWAADLSKALETNATEPPDSGTAGHSSDEMMAFFTDLIRAKRRSPGEDLVSELVRLLDSGELEMSEHDVIATSIMLYTGGFTTTANLLTNMLWLLMDRTDVYAELLDDPSLADVAVEESIRMESPARNSIRRTASESFEFGGRQFAEGDVVYAIAGAANRDPAVFDEPHRFDLHRDPAQRHVGFGGGIHVCIGSSLARIEIQEVLRALLATGRPLHRTAPVAWEQTFVLRRMKELEVAWTR